MRIITADQGSPEWHQARVGVPSGSRFKDLMAKGGGATRESYLSTLAVERATGRREEIPATPAMEIGVERESAARLNYEVRTGEFVTEIGFCMHDTLSVGVSPDGLVGSDGMTEYKCPQPKNHAAYMALKPGTCPSEYRWQVQGQLWIAEREWCDFVSYNPDFPDNAQLIIRRVWRDEEAIKELESEVIKFLEELEAKVEFIRNYKE